MAELAKLCVSDAAFSDALSRATADKARTRLRFSKWAEVLNRIGVPNSLQERLPVEDDGEPAR